MRQISKHDVNKLTAREMKARLPFQIVSDGEVIAVVLPAYDVNKLGQATKANHDVNKASELKFSKAKQAAGKLPR